MSMKFHFFRTVGLASLPLAALSFAGAQGPTAPITITHPASGGVSAPTEPIVIHDPYAESAHFVVRRLQLSGQGPSLHVQPGTTVNAELGVNFHCSHCATPHNHVLIGFPGQESAAACAWSGLRESGGWHNERFTFIAPMRPGVYPIRARGASTSVASCDDATLSYWTRDLPGGPGPDATIGVLVVESPRAPGASGAPVPPPATPGTTATVGVPGSNLAPSSIANGSFEQPDVAAGQSVPMAQLLGWTRSAGGGVKVHDGPGRAAGGSQWVELDGVDSSAIAADVGTSPDQSYLVTLAFAARPGTALIDNRLEVRWNGVLVGSVAASGEGVTHPSWTRLAIRVRSNGAIGRLELRDGGASNGRGTFVDEVSIAVAP